MIEPSDLPGKPKETVDFASLKKGKFVERLKAQHTKVKEDDRVGP